MQLIIFVHTDDGGVEALLFAVKRLITAVCVSCRKMRRKVLHDGNSLIHLVISFSHLADTFIQSDLQLGNT